jgi:hypothetical protein
MGTCTVRAGAMHSTLEWRDPVGLNLHQGGMRPASWTRISNGPTGAGRRIGRQYGAGCGVARGQITI